MDRVLEPELMSNPVQVEAYSNADFGVADDSFITRLDSYLSAINKQNHQIKLIVDLGCGPGNISERLARQWKSAQVVGIDGSYEMVAEARQRKIKAKDRDELKGLGYQLENISSLANGTKGKDWPVDVLVSNSVLHHLHDPNQLWQAVKTLAVPGTVLLHRDLRRPSSMKEAIALQRHSLPAAPEVLLKDFLASLQAAFTLNEVEIQLEFAGLAHLNVFEVEEKYLEVIGIF